MANSKYEYVRSFEQPDSLLINTWIVVRIDGRGFSKLTTKYKFTKPNDKVALDLMNAAAEAVMKELSDLVLAYGNSDEYSFVFHKDCALFERRASKLTTTIVSTFTSYYVFLWSKYFPDKPLTEPLPSFDGRAVCYPSDLNLRDYMSWRQVDCHINNLYNTTFWALVQLGGMGAREAEQKLSGTVSADKNEILFKQFGINYNNEPDCFKKGTVMYRDFFSTAKPIYTGESQATTQASHRRIPERPASQPPQKSAPPFVREQDAQSLNLGLGQTFFASSSTPSPPESPNSKGPPRLPNPLRSNPVSPHGNTFQPSSSMPISPPSTVASPNAGLFSPLTKHAHSHSNLTPLPLSPPTLRPSTKPPLSLDPPNPTTRTNFSPSTTPRDFPSAFPIAGYRHDNKSGTTHQRFHSASASMSTKPSHSGHRQRSPSQPHVPTYMTSDNQSSGPVIPMRLSSIPPNNMPRKLSLQNQRSIANLQRDEHLEKDDGYGSSDKPETNSKGKSSPPLRRDKKLPCPPMNQEEETRTYEKLKSSSPPMGSQPHRSLSDPERRESQWAFLHIGHPGIAELPAVSTPPVARKVRSHSQLTSAYASSSLTSSSLISPFQAPDLAAFPSPPNFRPLRINPDLPEPDHTALDAIVPPTPPLKDSPRSRAARAAQTASIASPPIKSSPDMSATPTQFDSIIAQTHSSPQPLPESQDSKRSSAAIAKQEHPPRKPRSRHSTQQAPEKDAGSASNEGRPVHMSRTQRDKDRKKRSTARVVVEHVDIIKDDFWEKRPWILSGKTG